LSPNSKNKEAFSVGEENLPEDFESALRELEQCVAAMERSDLSLEASLAMYQRGVKLAQVCQKKLRDAQQKVQVLEADLLRPLDLGESSEESE